MKQYVVTEAEFEKLLQELELHKFKGGSGLRTNIAIEIDKALKEPDGLAGTISERMTEFVMHDCYRSFLYHVHGWIQEMKK
jgi:hypothetical protein